MIAIVAALFLLGCVFGSFVSLVAHRLPRKESLVTGRSRDPSCGARIAARDKVPVFSWPLLGARCRSCGERISAGYPLAELGLGALWATTYLILGSEDGGRLALGLLLCALLLAITLTDLELRVIPNPIVLVGALAAVLIVIATDPGSLAENLIAAAAGGGVLFLVALAYPDGMGMGDVKLVAMMGLYLGRAIAPAVLIGLLAGAAVGAALITRHGSAARRRAIPFGPFLALGGVIALWFGDEIVDWYLDEFFLDS
ncbi:MAG: prepilin peptidase [Geminicoccaceae bacterium]|jgi:leader peptidase (prepilin peptidase)/N-methyltransferase|nr:prepilin peptidase [Solirubrobacterales bacterium]MCE3246405.1 prepilin peptidase [Geminicoccaceae bacterium]